jgi:hypothetical protein
MKHPDFGGQVWRLRVAWLSCAESPSIFSSNKQGLIAMSNKDNTTPLIDVYGNNAPDAAKFNRGATRRDEMQKAIDAQWNSIKRPTTYDGGKRSA